MVNHDSLVHFCWCLALPGVFSHVTCYCKCSGSSVALSLKSLQGFDQQCSFEVVIISKPRRETRTVCTVLGNPRVLYNGLRCHIAYLLVFCVGGAGGGSTQITRLMGRFKLVDWTETSDGQLFTSSRGSGPLHAKRAGGGPSREGDQIAGPRASIPVYYQHLQYQSIG
ncbi:hypothetical protein K439DRAFT_1401809 [Ramaria rubella]|nr:hypothetical protein K439DRAFT_1401809 [Ramaria rubella]